MTTDAQPHVSKYTYAGEGSVGEEREAFEQVLVVIVLDHCGSVGLEHKLRGVTRTQFMLPWARHRQSQKEQTPVSNMLAML